MNIYVYILCLLGFYSCTFKSSKNQQQNKPSEILNPTIQHILDSANVTGSILLFDTKTNTYYSNNFDTANSGSLPASTFKIPNSIVALELGNVTNEKTILKWDGVERNNSNWNQDLTLADAYRFSCVPCYQDLAKKAGMSGMQTQLEKIQYPPMVFDSSSLALFWLQGESRISQMEQIAFLQKLNDQKLPIQSSTYQVMKRIMLRKETNKYKLYGKTGLTSASQDAIGWFVGYVELSDNLLYFATKLSPGKQQDIWEDFVPARIDVTMKVIENFTLKNN